MFSKVLWENLKTFISIDSYPTLPCPYCNELQLFLIRETFEYKLVSQNAGNFVVNRFNSDAVTNFNNAAKSNSALEFIVSGFAMWDNLKHEHGKFIAFLVCKQCSNAVSVTGSARVPNIHAKNASTIGIKAEHFSPPLPIFPINKYVPESVIEELLRAFNYFHSDVPAAGAKLRRALEQMCLELGFKGKSLHHSIELMSVKYPEEGLWLQALKLVGNEATHSDGVDELDLLHSFEVFEAALDIFRRKRISENVATTLPKIEQKFLK